MTEPLNPILHAALQAHFGRVGTSNQGEARQVVYVPDYAAGRVRLRAEVIQAGEEYRVNCPFCNDTRGRLYVNHAYGEYDTKTRSHNYHLIHCFNEGCHEKQGNRDRFRQMVEVDSFWSRRTGRPENPARVDPDPEPPRIELPADLVPVNALPPRHPAAAYLRERGFDPGELAERWQVGYCEYAPETVPPVFRRIVIPVYRPPALLSSRQGGDRLVLSGWQARVVGDPEGDVPKYLFSAGLRKSRLLYGLPQALEKTGPVVVCEGPTDVWRFRSNAVALFGKSLSGHQAALLARHFAGRPIVLALDRDAREEAEAAADRLRRLRATPGGDRRVVTLELPEGGEDPADFSPDALAECLDGALAVAGPWNDWRTQGDGPPKSHS